MTPSMLRRAACAPGRRGLPGRGPRVRSAPGDGEGRMALLGRGRGAAAATRPSTRSTPTNAGKLEVAWRWYAANYGPEPDFIYRGTPIKVGNRLYAVAGQRRTVVAIDPATGETLWMWRMREEPRWEASTRKNYGKGVAYAEVEGRGVDLHDHARLPPGRPRRRDRPAAPVLRPRRDRGPAPRAGELPGGRRPRDPRLGRHHRVARRRSS